MLQPLKIPEWKWDEISMDFIMGLPRSQRGYDSIWVVVDRLTKVAHFISVKTTYHGGQIAEKYMERIVCLYGVPKRIVSDRGTQFTSKFWEKLLLGILNIITKSRLSSLNLVTVPEIPNLSLIPLKPSCHPQHDMRDAVLKYAIALLNK